MEFMDIKIAALEKAERMRKLGKEGMGLKLKEIQRENYTVDQYRNYIKYCKVKIDGEIFSLNERYYFDSKLPFLVMENYFERISETSTEILYCSDKNNVSLLCNYLPINIIMDKMKQLKREMIKNRLDKGQFSEIIRDKKLSNLDYICFKTITGNRFLFHITYWIHSNNETRIIGNYNCLANETEKCKLLEAMVLELNDRLEENYLEKEA